MAQQSSPTVLRLLVVFLVVAASPIAAVKPFIIPPTKNATTEAALIIVGASFINGTAYAPLAKAIQARSELRLWVVLLCDFAANFPNPAQLPFGVTGAKAALKKRGMTSDNIFVAGHSWGGECLAPYGMKHAVGEKLKGILLYGAYLFHNEGPLDGYPVPLMHLSGDLDGRVRVTRLSDTFQELEKSVAVNSSAIYRTPVVVMRGVNHAQFTSGNITDDMRFYDLTAEVTHEVAYQLIANQTAAFLATSLSVPGDDLTKEKRVLDASYLETRSLMKPLLELKAYDSNAGGNDTWVISAQLKMANVSQASLKVINRILSKEEDFVASKPSLVSDGRGGGAPLVETWSHVRYVPNPVDIPTFTHAPVYVAAKMKSRAALRNATGPASDSAANVTCRDINEAALQVALGKASALARQRYSSRGRQIVFHDDENAGTQLQWDAAQINLEENNHTLTVTSPYLWTNQNETEFPGFTGMHYCKLFVPFHAAEWIYIDSLRTHPIV